MEVIDDYQGAVIVILIFSTVYAKEMSNHEQKDVDITVNDNVLIIRGEKQAETDRKDKNFQVVERTYGSLYRAFSLPNGVDPAQITATMSNGVLKIKMPKPQASQPKKIEVKA